MDKRGAAWTGSQKHRPGGPGGANSTGKQETHFCLDVSPQKLVPDTNQCFGGPFTSSTWRRMRQIFPARRPLQSRAEPLLKLEGRDGEYLSLPDRDSRGGEFQDLRNRPGTPRHLCTGTTPTLTPTPTDVPRLACRPRISNQQGASAPHGGRRIDSRWSYKSDSGIYSDLFVVVSRNQEPRAKQRALAEGALQAIDQPKGWGLVSWRAGDTSSNPEFLASMPQSYIPDNATAVQPPGIFSPGTITDLVSAHNALRMDEIDDVGSPIVLPCWSLIQCVSRRSTSTKHHNGRVQCCTTEGAEHFKTATSPNIAQIVGGSGIRRGGCGAAKVKYHDPSATAIAPPAQDNLWDGGREVQAACMQWWLHIALQQHRTASQRQRRLYQQPEAEKRFSTSLSTLVPLNALVYFL
jgi:hypothetical protein